MLGNEYYRRRQFARAIEQFKRALELKPDYDLVVINMANAYRALGRDQEAMVGYRRFMELDPKNAQIRYEAAQILIDGGKLDEARQELTQALALEPKLAAARNALGVLALRRGDLAGAEREIRAAIDEKPDVRLAHYNLALLAEQRGDLPRAIAEYQQGDRAAPATATRRRSTSAGSTSAPAIGRASSRSSSGRSTMNPDFAEGHLFLAKLYLDFGQNLDEAVRLARLEASSSTRRASTPLWAITSSRTCCRGRGGAPKLNRRLRAGNSWSALNQAIEHLADGTTLTVTEWGPHRGRPERSILRRES